MKELSLHVLDLIENSIAAGATRIDVRIEEDVVADRLVIAIEDDGAGMPEDLAKHATDPFVTTRTTRRVGMGLALLSEAAEQAGGRFTLASSPGTGTCVISEFQLSNIDRAPLGRVEDSLAVIATVHPDLDLRYVQIGPLGAFSLNLLEITAEMPPGRAKREVTRLVREGRAQIGSVA